jgi:hypothetical protein
MIIKMDNGDFFMYADYDYVNSEKFYTPHHSPLKEFAKRMKKEEAERWFDMFKDQCAIVNGIEITRRYISVEIVPC